MSQTQNRTLQVMVHWNSTHQRRVNNKIELANYLEGKKAPTMVKAQLKEAYKGQE